MVHQILISNQIEPDNIIQIFTTLVINRYQIPTAENIVEFPLSEEDNFVLLRHRRNINQYYIVISVGQVPTKEEEEGIQKFIGLSDRVVCIQLDQEIQSRIQKYYIGVIPELYAKYTINKDCIQKPSLTFINETYKKAYLRQAQGIFCFKTIDQYNGNRFMAQALKASVPSLSQIGNLKLFKQLKQLSGSQFPALTVKELLEIYKNQQLSQREAAQLKYSIIGYKQQIFKKNKKLKAQQMLFQQSFTDVNKSILRTVAKENLSKKDIAKMEWKYSRIRIFCDLMWEENVNKQLVRKYKTCSLYDLQIEVIILQIKQFYRVWIKNTLKILKNSFNIIANRRDTKAVSEFRSKCSTVLQITKTCEQQSKTLSKNYNLVLMMSKQIEQFINSHQNVIKQQYLSAFKYISYEIKYLWKNQPKIYHKLGFLSLVLLLAWMQNNVIIGITLISIGLIFSAINI